MLKRKLGKKVLAAALALALTVSAAEVLPGGGVSVKAASIPEAAYKWTFEDATGTEAANSGSVSGGAASLKGTAKIQEEQLKIADKTYSTAANHVLTLSGGAKGSSYAELPKELYDGISSQTGVTWSFWMKAATDVASYSRLFSSADSSNGQEFAFAPFANDSVWNLIFDSGSDYKQVFNEEPEKGIWNLITVTVSAQDVKFYKNGVLTESNCGSGSANVLKERLDNLGSLVNHALGKTCSTWTDNDCAVSLDDVSVYKTALTAAQVKEIAEGYGLDTTQQAKPPVTADVSDDDGSDGLTEIEALKTVSKDNSITLRIWKDSSDRYYYSAYRNGAVMIQCSPIGLVTKAEDLSQGLAFDEAQVQKTEGKEEYDWVQGSSSHVSKAYAQTAFTMTKGDSKITMIFRVFDDGIGYRYEVDGDTGSSDEVTEITAENSSFVLPDSGTVWTMGTSATYEASTYTTRQMSKMKGLSSSFATPILGKIPTADGDSWLLLSEANVYNEKEPYCASVFETKSGNKAIQVKFGGYLKQEEDDSYDGKTYSASYGQISTVSMTDVFHTPWRLAILSDDLEGVVNSSLVSDLNPPAEGDFSWVKPGTSSWSWWSTSSDAIDFDTMFDYIDYAKETGQRYCLVDFGWELWSDYEAKIQELVAYAEPKGVDLILWYGVNKFDQAHIFDLDNEQTIEEQFAWCEKMGVKGVKVDYLNSDSQFAMKVMYDLASIAAKHKLILNYHGCTDPNGENRTFPNILSSEAVMGSEYFKWGSGSPVQSLLTLPYARNVIGSMEFTPVGMSCRNVSATDGFMLAMPIVYESAIQTLAHSAYVYQGYAGSSLFTNIPSTWDESRLLAGYPGESVVRARRSGENWYVGAMTKDKQTCSIPLDFLDADEFYYAYIYTDNETGTGIKTETCEVTSKDVLEIPLKEAGGCGIKLSKNDPIGATVYDNYDYYEAEDAVLGDGTTVKTTDYVSGKKFVDNVGKAGKNITFEKVNVKEAGEHELKVYIVSAGARDLYVKVNDEEPVKMEELVGVLRDGNAVSSKSITVNMKAGENTICLYNDAAAAPGIDRIAVSKSDISDAEVVLGQQEYEYSGQRNTPTVTVTRKGETLKAGKDYNVYYSNCVKAGTATVTVIGIGEFGGKATKQYEIRSNEPAPGPSTNPGGTPSTPATTAPADPTNTPQAPSPSPDDEKVSKPKKAAISSVKSKKKGSMVVKFKKLSKAGGYQLSYSTSKKFKKAKTKVLKAASSSVTIKKLKSKKTYYVRLRAFNKSGSKKVYGAWSKTVKVKVK